MHHDYHFLNADLESYSETHYVDRKHKYKVRDWSWTTFFVKLIGGTINEIIRQAN